MLDAAAARPVRRRVLDAFVSRDDGVEAGSLESGFGARARYRLRWGNISACSLICTICVLLVTAQRRDVSPVVSTMAFRASVPVTGRVSAQKAQHKLRTRLISVGNVCGVAAPNFRRYIQYMVMWHDGGPVDMFNPRVEPPAEGTPHRTVEETSLMCPTAGAVSVRRAMHVRLWYRDAAWNERKLDLWDDAAICAQHFYDVMRGGWPCPAVASRLPAIPDTSGAAG